MRGTLVAIALTATAFAAFAAPAAPPTAAAFNAQCKSDAAYCRTAIRARADALINQSKICVPRNVSMDQVANQVADTLDDVLDETGGEFDKADPIALIDQIIEFRWACKDRPTS